MKLKGVDFIQMYLDWLKSNIKTTDINDYIEITTPFLDSHNDHIQIYVKQENGKLTLTDDSYTISDLIMSGCDVNSSRRRSVLDIILNGFGVKIKNDELYVEANFENYPQKKHMLMQAMLSINDMFMLSQHRISSIFLEDVEKFMDDNNVRYIPSIQLFGKSGFAHTFDFVIPASKAKPERLIRALNNPNKQKAESVLFAWTDIKDTRKKESSMFIFLNDYEKTIKPDVINAFNEYDVKPILWTKRDNFVIELVS